MPSKVDLGFHVVNVRLLTKREMREETEDDHPEGEDFALPEGYWDIDNDTIAIGKWLPRMTQRWVLMHELGHACLDLRDRYDKWPQGK